MHTFTAMVPAQPLLPSDLALLLAPVRATEPSAPDKYVGRTDGVLLDEDGRVVAFILRLTGRLGARTLVPATAMSLTAGSALRLAWTEDQLRAQPRLDQRLRLHTWIDGGPPVESQWLPARAGVVPPGSGVNGTEAAKEGLAGGLFGAVIGGVTGLAIGGPIAGASLAVLFGGGGGLAGILSGASEETAAQAGEMKLRRAPAPTGAGGDLRQPGAGPARAIRSPRVTSRPPRSTT